MRCRKVCAPAEHRSRSRFKPLEHRPWVLARRPRRTRACLTLGTACRGGKQRGQTASLRSALAMTTQKTAKKIFYHTMWHWTMAHCASSNMDY